LQRYPTAPFRANLAPFDTRVDAREQPSQPSQLGICLGGHLCRCPGSDDAPDACRLGSLARKFAENWPIRPSHRTISWVSSSWPRALGAFPDDRDRCNFDRSSLTKKAYD
jgi:hypothetical protein